MATATLLFPTLAIADEDDDDDDGELVSDEDDDEDDTPVSMVEYFIKDFSVSLPDNWKILTEFDKDESGTSKGASYPTLFSATDVRTGSILTVVQEEACGLQDYSKSKEAGSPLVCDFVQPKEGAPPLFSTETYARDATQLLIRHDDREKANSASVGGSSISKLVDTNLIGYGSSYAKGMDSTMTSATYFETRSAVLDLEATTTTISLEEAAPIERRVLAKAVATTTTITKTTEVTKEAKAAASPEESTKQSPQEPALDVPAEKSPAPSESPPSSKTESGGVQDFSAGTLASPDRAAKSDASLPTATTMPSSTKDAEAEIKAPQTPATNIDAAATKSTVAVASSSVKNSSEQPGMSTLVTPPLNSDTTEATAVVFVESATSAPPIPTTTTTTANAETTFAPKEENASAGTTLTAALMATVASIVTDSLPSQAAVDDSTEGFDKIPKTITAVNPSEPNTIASATSESPASTAASSDATETTDVKDTATNETPATDTKTGTSSQTQPAPQTMSDSGLASVANTDGKKTSSLSAIEEKGQPEPQKSLQTVTADAQQQSATTTNESKSSSEKDPSPPTEKSSEKSSKSESTPEAPPTESPTTTTTTTNTIRSTTVVSIWLTARIDEWETPVTGDRLNEVWESVQYNNVGKKKQNKKTSDMSQEALGEDDTLNAQLLLMNRN
eukprot:jgi/Psemu1/324509/estExt_fgenesh1_pg.C_1510011